MLFPKFESPNEIKDKEFKSKPNEQSNTKFSRKKKSQKQKRTNQALENIAKQSKIKKEKKTKMFIQTILEAFKYINKKKQKNKFYNRVCLIMILITLNFRKVCTTNCNFTKTFFCLH